MQLTFRHSNDEGYSTAYLAGSRTLYLPGESGERGLAEPDMDFSRSSTEPDRGGALGGGMSGGGGGGTGVDTAPAAAFLAARGCLSGLWGDRAAYTSADAYSDTTSAESSASPRMTASMGKCTPYSTHSTSSSLRRAYTS